MNIKIFDDLVPVHLVDFFEMAILGKTDDKEKAMNPIVDLKCRYESTGQENGVNPLSFVHVLKSSVHLSHHLENFGLIPQLVCAMNNKRLQDIITARIFLLTPYETKLDHYAPHTDLPFEHTVVLYYVNNADGDTVFYDKGRIVKRVSPKRGRVVMFDGSIEHGGGIPKNGPRAVVNFDILTKENK